MEINETQLNRLLEIVRVLESRAIDGSHAMPTGRGGKLHAQRVEQYRIWRAEAEGIAANIKA